MAMLYQDGGTFITQWISITLLWALVLWRLRQPALYQPLFKDKAVLFYTLFIAWTVWLVCSGHRQKLSAFLIVALFWVAY
ncbi:hypothetical protein BPLS_P5836 [Bathymodiolus platifrons methanotrophic gill symbiont]|nr:hypothetical protein BMR08_10950 [Methylococcaceae bacterium CS2]GFO77405.1 hypothetical protein BPLS_P5836 [Bathymodiolus platifrons methanotrophic gill symbiont]